MDILIVFAALLALIWGAWAGVSVLILTPVLAALACEAMGMPVLASYTQIYMPAAGGFVVSFFPLFFLGAVFGKVMEDSGAARRLARFIAQSLGPSRAILAVVLSCAILTYGGVSLFVVAFVAWPLARALFAEVRLPHRLIPATIALGAFTFTMTALPGTPSIQNAIPMATFGTTAFAAPGLGLIAGLIMCGLGMAWLNFRVRTAGDSAPPTLPETVAANQDVSLLAALAPILSVGVVTLFMGSVIFPKIDTSYLATPTYGNVALSSVQGLWSVLVALCAAISLALVLARPPNPLTSLNKGAESCLLPLFNTACLVGFGAVIASLPGFAQIREALDGLAGGNVVISAALSSGLLAGVTGSASGGMSIALATLGPQLVADAAAQLVEPSLLHRVVSVATGGLDTLPHNGAVITLLGICGLTHKQAYSDIFVVAVLIPIVACGVIIGLGIGFGAF